MDTIRPRCSNEHVRCSAIVAPTSAGNGSRKVTCSGCITIQAHAYAPHRFAAKISSGDEAAPAAAAGAPPAPYALPSHRPPPPGRCRPGGPRCAGADSRPGSAVWVARTEAYIEAQFTRDSNAHTARRAHAPKRICCGL